jgi:hypothetical protein
MKKIYSLLLFAAFLSGSALASCPQIEGKYNYTCTVERDAHAEFADVLEVSGQMLVQQNGCDAYHFMNENTQLTEDFRFQDISDARGRTRAKIGKTNSNVIKFKTIAHLKTDLGVDSLSASVTKGKIRMKKDGFMLKGKERSRVLGIFGKRHSKFTCRFKTQE